MTLVEELRYDAAGLVPAVLQDHETREVLVLAYMDREALERTLSTGLVHFRSRSRGELWLKGERSGRVQRVVELRPNCELDSLLVLVRQDLPGACHTGHSSCFYRRLEGGDLVEVAPPLFDPAEVYGGDDASGADGPESLRRLLEAYRWLAAQPEAPGSRTSVILHGAGPDPLDRVREEWDELLGVLGGTHQHTTFEEDALLEAYQVLYWTCLAQVRSDPEGAVAASDAVARGYAAGGGPEERLREAFERGRQPDAQLRRLWEALGMACRRAGLAPDAVARRDLEELVSKPYMAAHAAESGRELPEGEPGRS